jgi:hypothetical protein
MTGSRLHRSIRRPPAYQQGAEITGFMIMLPVNLIVLAIMFDFGTLPRIRSC